MVNLQSDGATAKAYQVRQVVRLIEEHRLVSINTFMVSLIAEGCGRREGQPASAQPKPGRSGKRKAAA